MYDIENGSYNSKLNFYELMILRPKWNSNERFYWMKIIHGDTEYGYNL